MLIQHVLVVDDDSSLRETFGSVLPGIGYTCEVASDYSSALEKLRLNYFDLVISDIRMGEKDGLELMQEAKRIQPHLDFIIMTGYAPEYSYNDIINAGAIDFIAKPFELGELKAKIGRIEREKLLVRQLYETNMQLERTLEQTIEALSSATEMRDPYTAGHQRRVAKLACAIAEEMGLSEEQTKGIRLTGLVHDVGKISVPAEILTKPSTLSDIEMSLIMTHSQSGYDILKAVQFPWPIAKIVLQHHERMDGSGYPLGIRGEDILLEARIMAIADVVEAMSSHRPYRAALGIDSALEEIDNNRGILYDPEVVNTCMVLLTRRGYGLT
jgi:putative two-component system response regulator